MNLLFIGSFYPKGIVERIVEDTRGKVGFSNHNFEMSLINGFAKQEDIDLRVIAAPMVFSFPHNNKRAFYKKTAYKCDDYNVSSIGFCNIALLNMLSQSKALEKTIRREVGKFEGDAVTIVVNTPSMILSSALFKAVTKVKNKKVTTVLIVPDIPECMVEMSARQTLKNRLVGMINKHTATLSKLYDKYVYLTEAMNDYYHASSDDYIVMEGLIDDKCMLSQNIAEDKSGEPKEIILYTGTLRRIFGVTFLVDVFEKGNFNNAELWICGSGEAADEIADRARQNDNIKFYGLVDSARARELQSMATVLVNPRSSEGRYTRYSFPSKTIEYLLAGKTVLMNKLPGIPHEYDKFVHYPDNESEEAWVAKLNEIFAMSPSERSDRDIAGRQFILSNKTASKQCARIINLCLK